MEDPIQREHQLLIKNMSQLLSLSKLYNTEHPVFSERLSETLRCLKSLTLDNKSLIISGMEGVLFVNAQKVELKSKLMERFLESLSTLQLGSVDIEPGATAVDIIALVNILNQKDHLRGVDQIKDYLDKKNITHIIPQFASYKLVKKDEKIVKEKGAVNISDLPQEVIDRFSQDLGGGHVVKTLKEGNIKYKAAAHDPAFLSGFVYKLAEKKNTAEELENILWLVGSYLIDEISTAKEEEVNARLLEEFKIKLLSLWENKKDATWNNVIHKSVTAISAALELKGLVVLYKKHKKAMTGAIKKINYILETLPKESQLYKKTKEELES